VFTYLGTVLGPSLFSTLASAVGVPRAYLVMGTAVLLSGIVGAFGPAARPRNEAA
jgi:hypothetical protein